MIQSVEFNDATHKLFSDNRESYFAQSARTKDGVVPAYEHGLKIGDKDCPNLGQQS